MMGRPKGSKNLSHLDPNNIVGSSKQVDENENFCPAKVKEVKGPRRDTRSKTDKFWHSVVGLPIEFFPPSKLPQNRAVIRRYLAMREKIPKAKQYILVNQLYEEVVNVTWVPARIPTVSEKLCKNRIKNVIDRFLGLKHHCLSDKRDSSKKIDEMKEFLGQLCDLAPKDLYEMLKKTARLNDEWESDWQFYQNMCQPGQVGCMAGEDLTLSLIHI